jgi:hypothetical protein
MDEGHVVHLGRIDFRNDHRLFCIKHDDRFSHVYVNLPVDQATRFQFVLNMKTAKAIGLKIPDVILRADKAIE